MYAVLPKQFVERLFAQALALLLLSSMSGAVVASVGCGSLGTEQHEFERIAERCVAVRAYLDGGGTLPVWLKDIDTMDPGLVARTERFASQVIFADHARTSGVQLRAVGRFSTCTASCLDSSQDGRWTCSYDW